MPQAPNKITQFWQELKRRRVVRVITVYAAAAFVILELVDIITEPFGLPDWTMILVVVLLTVGFIISVIISWIYDIHPEGGIVKTESVHRVKVEDAPPTSNSWKIASYISFVVIVALIVLNISPRASKSKDKAILDKSIAVLPFINDSPDEENAYFINGIMEEIILNLQAIKELRVPGRTSIEQYRNPTKSIPEIANELDVNFIVEASGQKYGNTFVLRVQLLEGETDKHLWGESYEKEIIGSPEVLIRIQSQIAESIATELQAIITPEEKQLIEKIPTTSLTAHDFYQRGKEEHWKYWSDNDNIEALERAEVLYHDALEYDSAFAKAYAGLARVFWHKHYWETYFSEEFLDSVLILANIALSYDDQLAEAYTVRGEYYNEKGFIKMALEEYREALRLNPNDWEAYRGIGLLHTDDDLVKAIDNSHKAASLQHGSELPDLLRNIGISYHYAGFNQKGDNYFHEAFKLDNDSVRYYSILAITEWGRGNFAKSIDSGEKGYAIDSNNISILGDLGMSYMFFGHYEESLKYYEKYVERLKELSIFDIYRMDRIGYVYLRNGYKEKAEYFFNEQIRYSNRMNKLGRERTQQLFTYYDLASVYAARGEKEKAYENLRIFNQRKTMPNWAVTLIKDDPLFDSIKDEPEYLQIVKDVESKYQAEHKRVRQWLEENDML